MFFYLVFYGQFELDLLHFTGAVALSIALNNGVRGPEPARQEISESETAEAPLLGTVGAPALSRI
jgi:hypothetical protein